MKFQGEIWSYRLTQASKIEKSLVPVPCRNQESLTGTAMCQKNPTPPHAHNTHKHNLTAKATGY